MRQLVYLASAQRDFAAVLLHITKESISRIVARGFVGVLRQQCRKLAALPGTLGRSRPELRPDMRSVAYKGHVVFFRYDAGIFEVVNVLEGRRDIIAYFRDDPAET